MTATDAQIETLALLDEKYEALFGYPIPAMELPSDPDAQIRIVRECIAQRSEAPIAQLIPPGSYT